MKLIERGGREHPSQSKYLEAHGASLSPGDLFRKRCRSCHGSGWELRAVTMPNDRISEPVAYELRQDTPSAAGLRESLQVEREPCPYCFGTGHDLRS